MTALHERCGARDTFNKGMIHTVQHHTCVVQHSTGSVDNRCCYRGARGGEEDVTDYVDPRNSWTVPIACLPLVTSPMCCTSER